MDKYTKLQKIGQGSFGSAYLCVKKLEPHGRKYVIKEIRMDPRDQHTALKEAKLLAALDHPNIIACRESFLAAPLVLCIVTEFADGGDLRRQLTERTSRREPYRESELLDLFLQCCLALKHLHDRKILHRDIKPENIFLTSSHVVKLGDFGVATVLSHTLACAQTLTGTPYYTSPEICLGKSYNSKTDVWSLGCVLYELATFSHAFHGRSQRQLFENIVHGSYVPVSTSRYSPRLVALVDELLQKNPRDRPSVNQLIRRPILMERVQNFLSQRAVADALTHTVLHGQHIFRKPNASPVPVSNNRRAVPASPVARVRAVQYEPPKKKPEVPRAAGVRGGAVRRNSLKASGSKKKLLRKLVSPAKPSPAQQPVKAVAMPPPPPAAGGTPSHQIQHRLQQRKQELAAKEKEKAKRPSRVVAQPPPPPPTVAERPTPAAPTKQPEPRAKATPTPAKASPAPSHISDRVSAFNAQWQAQRKQILRNLTPTAAPLPPPPPVSAVPVKKPEIAAASDEQAAAKVDEATPAPPALLQATGIVVQRAKKPSSAAALAAAKQREAMRRDIQEKKQRRASAASASPLDDPVILVQNLPDYNKPRGASKAAAGGGGVVPPPAPTAMVATTDLVQDDVAEEEKDDDDDDVPTPDSTVAENANLEFQRMLLQLQSVVDEPEHANDDDDDDEQVEQGDNAILSPVAPLGPGLSDKDEELRGTTTLPPPPFDAAVEKPSVVLSLAMLEDPVFKAALRAKLRGEASEAPIETELNGTQAKTLAWLHAYIHELL